MSVHADRAAALQWVPWLIPICALGVFVAPMVLTSSGFMPDWTNHLWLVQRQKVSLQTGGPSLYLHADQLGVFYPQFAFYGGTLYAATAFLALLLGHTTAAYIATWAIAFAAAYGGTTWFAMQCGLRSWRAQVPGLFLVTSAYFVTNVYGRGAWPEFVAVAVVPLLLASATRLLRGPWTPLPLLAFVGSAIVFSGSHNITLLYGVLFLAGVGGALAVAVRRRPDPIEVRRLAALAGVGVLCVGVNLWFLLPDVWFADRTRFGVIDPFAFETQRFLSSLGALFHPGRVMFPELEGKIGERIYLQFPVLAFAWIATALVVMRKRATPLQRRVTWVLIVAAVPLAFFTATTEPWHWLPKLLRQVQFGYRLESYLVFAAAGLVIVALSELTRAPRTIARPLTIALGVVMVTGSVLAVWQVFNPPEFLADRHAVFSAGHNTPRSWYDGGVYRDNSPGTPIVRVRNPRKRTIEFDVASARANALTMVVDPPSGTGPLRTNLAAGEYLIDIEGLEPIGRSLDGLLVVRRPTAHLTGPITVTISRPTGGPVEVGRIASILSAIGLLGVIAATTLRSLRTRAGKRRRDDRSADATARGTASGPTGSTTPPPVPTVRS